MSKKWDTDRFRDYINDNHSDFELRSEYFGNSKKVILFHKKCHREFEIYVNNFKRRGRCPLCYGKFKRTTQEFKELVFELVGDEYSVVSEYETCKKKVVFLHHVCGAKFKATPDDFTNGGTRCPECFGNKRKTTEQFCEEVKMLFGDKYSVLGDYINNKTPLLMRHNESCNHEFMVSPDAFLRGSHCNKCGTLARSGENHYKYNPLLTKEEREKRDMFNGTIRKWRDKVYIRDNYTCQICKETGGKLNAHHLNSWDTHKEERFEIDNGVTLCEKCHKEFHRIYGYGNNTKEQFTQHFLNKTKAVFS